MIEIPLTSEPSQTLSMNIGSAVYNFRIIYNTREEIWSIDIIIGDEDIVSGVNIVGGVDLLKQYPELNLKNLYAISLTDGLDATPDNLGTDVKLMLLTDEEVLSVSSV